MRLNIKEISLVAIFPALMAATAGISIPLGGLPPISLQTIFVFLAALLLGPKLGTLSIIIYVIMGAIGLPVFSNYRGGISVLISASFRRNWKLLITLAIISFMSISSMNNIVGP